MIRNSIGEKTIELERPKLNRIYNLSFANGNRYRRACYIVQKLRLIQDRYLSFFFPFVHRHPRVERGERNSTQSKHLATIFI